NCGISGDSAAGGFARLDWDVLVHKPTVATIMMGMNDVNRGLYGKDEPDEANLKRRQEALDRHADSMRKMAAALVQAGVKPIFILPSIYDDTSTMDKPNLFGVNGALGICAEGAAKLAEEHQAGVVDFWGEMNRVTAVVQQADPTATIVGGDRVHPGPMGHFLMAYTFLAAQQLEGVVAALTVDAAAGQALAQENCTVSDVEKTATGVRFVYLAKALPFPIQRGTEKALELVPFVAKMNQETLRVQGLAEGDYALLIDGQEVGVYAGKDLADGIDLAANPKTPQYQQAEEVAKVNGQRHGIESGSIRNIVATERTLRSQNLDLNDPAARQQAVDTYLTKIANSPYVGYYKGACARYLKDKEKEAELRQQWRDACARIFELNQPKPHTCELVRR
ncbi:MAG: GDSL-type esterase/lipase family protein, partial [Lentisphaeria bacterium]|nr:GDSL-type esterase/lipase family protein [Lentisphaeria bacterium]